MYALHGIPRDLQVPSAAQWPRLPTIRASRWFTSPIPRHEANRRFLQACCLSRKEPLCIQQSDRLSTPLLTLRQIQRDALTSIRKLHWCTTQAPRLCVLFRINCLQSLSLSLSPQARVYSTYLRSACPFSRRNSFASNWHRLAMRSTRQSPHKPPDHHSSATNLSQL